MTGAADPMMFFPAGTTFTPYSVLRNVSDAPISLTLTLWWMEGAEPHSAHLPSMSLLPYQTQSLDMKSLLSLYGPKNFNGSFNLVFGGEATRGGLVMSSGSVDQTNNYVFEVGARGAAEGGGKSLQYWSTGNGDDTMVTMWNPADEAQDFVFTLFFAGGHYALPIHLEPRATRGFNVSEIIQNQVPDAEGTLIPVSVHEGSANISGSLAENQHILVTLEAGIYNVRKATCGQVCQTCNGVTEAAVLANPFGMAVRGTYGLNLMGTYNTGGQYALSASWSSSKTSVATVGATSGMVTGVAAGTAYISGGSGEEPIGVGYLCEGGDFNCPEQDFGGQSPGTVFDVGAFGPDYIFVGSDPTVYGPNKYQVTNSAGTALPQPTGGTCCAASSDPSDSVTQIPNGNNPFTFQFETTDQSATVGDRTLTFEYDLSDGEGTSVQLNVTAREFSYLTNNTPSNTCTLGYGTKRSYVYNVYTHPDGNVVLGSDGLANVPVTENFSPTISCGTDTGNTILNSNAQFTDGIVQCSNKPLACSQTVTQTISVAGYCVRKNTLKFGSSGVIYTPTSGPCQ